MNRTGRKALLQLLGLVGVLEDKGVQVTLAADLELDLRGLGVLLDPGGYNAELVVDFSSICVLFRFAGLFEFGGKHTGGILPPADLDELLNDC